MTITETNFIPILFLASGSFAASGDATVIVQQFAPYSTATPYGSTSEYLDITATGASVGTLRDADTKYEIYLTASSSGGTGKSKGSSSTTTGYFAPQYVNDDIVSWLTPVSTDSSIGTAENNYYTGTAKLQFYSSTSSSSEDDAFNPHHDSSYSYSLYTQLKFDLDGVTTYGVAEILFSNQSSPEWRSVRYEVSDAVAPVAEPAVWAEMIAGFGAIGAAMRRRRHAPRARRMIDRAEGRTEPLIA